jgi:cytoskeletal protein CcmA (bactofilin family)
MWNWRDQAKEETLSQSMQPAAKETLGITNPELRRTSMAQTAIIGESIHVKGELTGSENLTIDGKVEGTIELKEHHLTIGPKGLIKANINAKTITIFGEVLGNVCAKENVEIKEKGKLLGDITAPRVAIADGAFFKGSVDMEARPPQLKVVSGRDEKVPSKAEVSRVEELVGVKA